MPATHKVSQPLSQPKGLYPLFMTELWERFGFYTLQTILVLYLTQKLLFTDQHANLLYGSYSSLLYISPVLGGFLADHFLGYRKSVWIGGILLLLGYALCAVPNVHLFYLGLSFNISGNGLLKPNISSLLGRLYQKHDPRREGGFTLFYMGINIGALLPPIFTGALVARYGWHIGFLFAALGMGIGIIIFAWGQSWMKEIQHKPKTVFTKKSHHVLFYSLLIILILAVIIISYAAMIWPKSADSIMVIASALAILAVFIYLFKEKRAERVHMIAALVLIVVSIGFWALYNQTFSLLMLYASRNMNKNLLGMQINPEFTQFFNPFFIIVLSPVLSRLWLRLEINGKNPSIPLKFGLAILFMCFGFWFLVWGTGLSHPDGLASVWWLIGSYFLQTVGELLLSPIGLAMITVLSPPDLVGMMMGVWFFSLAGAFALGAPLANLAAMPDTTPRLQAMQIYHHGFYLLALFATALVIVSFALIPWLQKMIGFSEKKMHHKHH